MHKEIKNRRVFRQFFIHAVNAFLIAMAAWCFSDILAISAESGRVNDDLIIVLFFISAAVILCRIKFPKIISSVIREFRLSSAGQLSRTNYWRFRGATTIVGYGIYGYGILASALIENSSASLMIAIAVFAILAIIMAADIFATMRRLHDCGFPALLAVLMIFRPEWMINIFGADWDATTIILTALYILISAICCLKSDWQRVLYNR